MPPRAPAKNTKNTKPAPANKPANRKPAPANKPASKKKKPAKNGQAAMASVSYDEDE